MGFNTEIFNLYDLAKQAVLCAKQNCASALASATSATASASSAAASATSADADATLVQGLSEDFNEKYLGSFPVDPVPPIQEGALYFNTVADNLYVWDGVAWNAVAAGFNELTNFLATGTSTARNLVTRFSDRINVLDFGADPTGVLNSQPAIQSAITALGPNGGVVWIPSGIYRTESTITIDRPNVTLMGDGASSYGFTGGSAGVVPDASVVIKTEIRGDFTSGPVIHVKKQACTLSQFGITATTTRKNAARLTVAPFNCGIRVEAEDLSGQTTRRFFTNSVVIVDQPSDGIVLVNDIVASRIEARTVACCKGHGFVVAGGHYSARVNKTRPGQLEIWNSYANDLSGHAILVGGNISESTSNDIPYRINISNFECFYCCYTPAICENPAAPSTIYLSGENHVMISSAMDGRSRFPAISDTHTPIEIRGRWIDLFNNRFIDGNPYIAKIVGHPLFSSLTRSVFIHNPTIINSLRGAGFYNPAVFYGLDCESICVTNNVPSSLVSKLSSQTSGSKYLDVYNGSVFSEQSSTRVGAENFTNLKFVGRTSPSEYSLNDDKAAYIDFGGIARGTISISGNTSSAKSAVVSFRCGDASAYATLLAGPAGTAVTTGQLTGTTGVDGNFTISADTATNRLYIENRTGGIAAYQYTITPINDGLSIAGLVIV